MTTPLLEIKDLHIHFRVYEGTLKVLNGMDFTIKNGEKVGLIGETGCGKTVPMKAVLRILPSHTEIPKGRILFKGKNILEMNMRELQEIRRKSISMIFQDPTAALNPVLKIGEQVTDAIRYSAEGAGGSSLSKKEIRRKAIEILKDVALPDPERIMENYPCQLSGGMRQRICIAMALASATELLIADEPGTSLDATIQDQILRLLKDLVAQKGTSIILITHSLGTVKGLTNRIYVMYAGNIAEVAKTEDLFSDPLHPYTHGLLKAVPKLTGGGMLEGIRGSIPSYLDPPKGCRFFPRCDYARQVCETDKPPFFNAGDAHEVACFLYQK
jgi:peptide/nickel transport system ATP-binding protein